MATKNKPYEAFGPYLLFKKLENDSLSELWRAGRLDGGRIAATVAVRRLSGGNREALVAAAHAAEQVVPQLTGASFARDQHVGVINGTPFIAYDYANGRSLRYIVDRARGGNGVPPNPVPLDQAIVIAEKVALSLATTADLRDGGGQRLSHGALIPQFIWITDDGEIRVAGQLLGKGLVASLAEPKVASELGRYFSPEYRHSGEPSKTAEVWSLGAILFMLVTGQEPPDAATASAFVSAVRAAKTMSGAPIPDDIRVLIDKSLNIDPSMRFATLPDMKQAISALAHGGKYSATTFNLAFYLSNLLKKEMEAEPAERERESKVNLAPYAEAPAHAPASAHAPAQAVPTFGIGEEPKRSKAPLAIAAVVVAAIAVGGWFMFGRKSDVKPAAPKLASATPTPAPPRVVSEPVLSSPTTATSTAGDAAAKQRAFEDAVKQKLQAEMMKLQGQFTQQLKQEQSKNAPVATTPAAPQSAPSASPAEERAPSAAQLDQQRREPAPVPTPATQTVAQAPTTTTTQPPPTPAAPAPAAVVASVREGDVIDVNQVDSVPRMLKPIKPVYPPLAARQRIEATVMVSALVSETGDVLDVRILRGDGRFGLNDAAIRAMRGAKFAPAMKDGKRVRTWYPQTFLFKP